MKVVVYGANGRVGQLVVAELIKRGHEVRAFVHGSSPFETSGNLSVMQGDIYDIASVEASVEGMDAAMSTLGSWGTKKKNVLTAGMENIVPSMQAAGVVKIVSLTGADCKVAGDKMSWVHNLSHAFFSAAASKILKDGERHIDLLASSDLDWSVLRSPVMNEKGDPSAYTISMRRPHPWNTINRHSVALAMVDLLDSNEYTKQAPFIGRR